MVYRLSRLRRFVRFGARRYRVDGYLAGRVGYFVFGYGERGGRLGSWVFVGITGACVMGTRTVEGVCRSVYVCTGVSV